MPSANPSTNPSWPPGERWIVFNHSGIYDLEGNLLAVPKVSPIHVGYYVEASLDGYRYVGRGKEGLLLMRMHDKRKSTLPRVKWGITPPEEKKRLQRALKAFYAGYMGEVDKPKAKVRQFLGEWYLELWQNNKMVTRL